MNSQEKQQLALKDVTSMLTILEKEEKSGKWETENGWSDLIDNHFETQLKEIQNRTKRKDLLDPRSKDELCSMDYYLVSSKSPQSFLFLFDLRVGTSGIEWNAVPVNWCSTPRGRLYFTYFSNLAIPTKICITAHSFDRINQRSYQTNDDRDDAIIHFLQPFSQGDVSIAVDKDDHVTAYIFVKLGMFICQYVSVYYGGNIPTIEVPQFFIKTYISNNMLNSYQKRYLDKSVDLTDWLVKMQMRNYLYTSYKNEFNITSFTDADKKLDSKIIGKSLFEELYKKSFVKIKR